MDRQMDSIRANHNLNFHDIPIRVHVGIEGQDRDTEDS